MPRWRGTTVADVVLDVADDGAFEVLAERWDVTDGEHGAAAAVDVLARVHALDGDEELLLVLVPDEIGTETAVVVVVDLSRGCNRISLWGSP